ncbi:MAG: SDR family oxidoreductase [Acidimicrobiia bacterium]|nr:SDR family oxidoreductase [Acidimicrobiia bacterium]
MADAPVAILTQCGDYVGPYLARRLASSGHRLVLHGAKPELLDELKQSGATVVGATGDLTTGEGNQSLVADALSRFGRIDAACFLTGLITAARFLDTTAEQWDLLKLTCLDMPFHALQAVLPPMADAGYGNVVVYTSATGKRGEPRAAGYSAARAGANMLVEMAADQVAGRNVCVNAIGTNFMDFPGLIKALGAEDPVRRAKLEAQVPLGRFGTMDELAEFTSMLLDGRSRFQTGQFISFSGGWSK